MYAQTLDVVVTPEMPAGQAGLGQPRIRELSSATGARWMQARFRKRACSQALQSPLPRNFTSDGSALGVVAHVFRTRWDPFRRPETRRAATASLGGGTARNSLRDSHLHRAGDGTRTHDVQLGKEAEKQGLSEVRANSPLKT